MVKRDLVVIGASAGGVEVLRSLVARLEPDLAATVLVVLHLSEGASSSLAQILGRASDLPVGTAVDGERLLHGTIRVAPPGSHLLVIDGHLRLSRGPWENGHRPSIDVLFRSAAMAAGPRAVGLILSGALDDGTAGMMAIKGRGGLALVQDPDDALFDGMPRSVLAQVEADRIVTAASAGEVIGQVCGEDVGSLVPAGPSSVLDRELLVAQLDLAAIEHDHTGVPSPFACPDCAGVLWQIDEEGLERYRCRVGHAWSPQSLLAEQHLGIETALWAAFRALEEQAHLARRLADRMTTAGLGGTAGRFRDRADAAGQHAARIRDLIDGLRTPPGTAGERTPT